MQMPGANRGIADEALAGIGQTYTAPTTLKERNTKSALKQLDAPTNGRLRKVEGVGSPAETSMLRDQYRIFEVTEIESEIRQYTSTHNTLGKRDKSENISL